MLLWRIKSLYLKFINACLSRIMMEKEDFDFEGEYGKLKIKYSLPDFGLLAEDFDIEKLFEKESSFIIREIRRAIAEKLGSYLQLFEMLMNPSGPPIFIFSILRKLNSEERNKIKEIYNSLSKYQLEIMKLDIVYNEEKESNFVKSVFNDWQKLKIEIYDLIKSLEKDLEEDSGSRDNGYFG